jgi:putative ABC transport system permease protein
VTEIAGTLSADFLKLVLLASIIASPAAWLVMNKWLQNYPYRIGINWAMFGFAIIGVVLVALFTISFQAIRAAVANPVKSLRTE